MNNISMKLNADNLILLALQEDITSEDITTNSVMRDYQLGEVELICKEDGVIAGLDVFKRVFELLDDKTEVTFTCKDGDEVKKGQKLGLVRGDIRVLLSGERTALNYLVGHFGVLALEFVHLGLQARDFVGHIGGHCRFDFFRGSISRRGILRCILFRHVDSVSKE